MKGAFIVFVLFLIGYGSCCIVQGSDAAVYLTGSGAYLVKNVITGNAVENESYYYSADCLVYKGHYGNYLVSLCSDQFGDSVRISGGETGGNAVEALTLELGWLAENGVVAGLGNENTGKIGAVLNEKGGYAVYDKGWVSLQSNCNPDGKCYKCGPSIGALTTQALPAIGELVLPSAVAPAEAAGAEMEVSPGGTAEKKEGIEPILLYASVAIALAVILGTVVFTMSRQRMVGDIEVHKALSNETRIGILNELSDVNRIPTDLSSRLGKSKATVSEHLERLIEAGLIERIEVPGKKFVYYKITSKGKDALRRMAG